MQEGVRPKEGKQPLFQRGQEDGPELKPLGGVQRHDLHLFGLLAHQIEVLPQTDPVEQPFPRLALFRKGPQQRVTGRRIPEKGSQQFGFLKMSQHG